MNGAEDRGNGRSLKETVEEAVGNVEVSEERQSLAGEDNLKEFALRH